MPEGTPYTALKNEGWVKCGDNINYKISKLSVHQSGIAASQQSNAISELQERPIRGKKKYFMLTFEYTFKRPNDEVYFAYALPYTFSKLHNFIRELMD